MINIYPKHSLYCSKVLLLNKCLNSLATFQENTRRNIKSRSFDLTVKSLIPE